jgi:hypothetical protein
MIDWSPVSSSASKEFKELASLANGSLFLAAMRIILVTLCGLNSDQHLTNTYT